MTGHTFLLDAAVSMASVDTRLSQMIALQALSSKKLVDHQFINFFCARCASPRLPELCRKTKIKVNHALRQQRPRWAKFASIESVECLRCSFKQYLPGELSADKNKRKKEEKQRALRSSFLLGGQIYSNKFVIKNTLKKKRKSPETLLEQIAAAKKKKKKKNLPSNLTAAFKQLNG